MSEAIDEGLRTLQELGAELQKARESRALTLENVAEATCIRKNFLEDIEAGNFDNFVALVYARGFVRSYTEYMELPELWHEYSQQLILDNFKSLPRSQRKQNADRSKYAAAPQSYSSPKKLTPPAAQTRGFTQSTLLKKCIIVLLVIIVGGCAALWANWDRIVGEITKIQQNQALDAEQTRKAQNAELAKKKSAEMAAADEERRKKEESDRVAAASVDAVLKPGDLAAAAGSAASGDAGVHASAAKSPDAAPVPEQVQPPVQKRALIVRSSGECWLRLTQGKKVLTERTVRKDYEQSFELTEPIVARFGAGHRIQISVNGEPFKPIGKGVQRLEFRPDGKIVDLGK